MPNLTQLNEWAYEEVGSLPASPFRVRCCNMQSPTEITWHGKTRAFIAEISDLYDLFGHDTVPLSFVVRNIDTRMERTYTYHKILFAQRAGRSDEDAEVSAWVYRDLADDTRFHLLND